MADLLDIAPSTAVDVVTLGDGRTIDVRLLNASDVAGLLARFPGLFPVLVGGIVDGAALIGSGGKAIAAIIAAGSDHLGDEKAEAVASSFSIEDQLKLLDTILRLTFPNGVGPVMQALEGIGATLMRGAVGDAKIVKMPSKSSPSPSPISSGEVSRQAML
jgi:hypothetical protein